MSWQCKALSIFPLFVTVTVAMLRDRIPGGHFLVITTSARGAYRTTAVLVDDASSKHDLLLEQPSVLIGPAAEVVGQLRLRV